MIFTRTSEILIDTSVISTRRVHFYTQDKISAHKFDFKLCSPKINPITLSEDRIKLFKKKVILPS
jgi:hypothetical protein